MRKIFLVIFTFSCVCTMAQKKKAPKTPDPTPFAKTITSDDLKKHLYIVAGAEMEGRETATDGQKKAAAYIENHFKTLGLAPGNSGIFQQTYPVFQDSLVSANIEVNGKKFEVNKDFAVNMGSAYTATMLGSEVVFVGYGISDSTRDDYKGINARGKIVLILAGSPPSSAPANTTNRRQGFNPFAIQDAAAKNGAAAILQVQTNFPRRAAGGRGNMYTSGFRRTIYPNTFSISEGIAESIMGGDYAAAKAAMQTGNPVAKAYNANMVLDFSKITMKSMHSKTTLSYLQQMQRIMIKALIMFKSL